MTNAVREQQSVLHFPTLSRLKTLSAGLFSRNNIAPYLNTYYILKAQKTFLTDFRERMQANSNLVPPELEGKMQSFYESLQKLITCSMADLYALVTEQIQNLRTVLCDPAATAEFESAMELCFKALLTITRRLYAVAGQETDGPSEKETMPSPKRDSTADSLLCEDDVVVCRICDQAVRLEDFQQHTLSCIAAYRSESKIEDIHMKLAKSMEGIRQLLVGVEWPGPTKIAVKRHLPLLHAFLLVDRIISVDPSSPNATDECNVVIGGLEAVMSTIDELELNRMISMIRERVNELRHTAIAMHDAAEVLKMTRVSGNSEITTVGSTTIADFRFIRLISAGAYARVYLAKKTKTGDIFAIKVQPKSEVMRKNQLERVFLEKDLLMQLMNPFIINFYYSIVGKHNLYIVMEYLPGGDLYSLLTHLGGLDEETTKVYMFQIASALDYLHSHGIIHRDLKPDNVLISSTGMLKLTDFGLSYRGYMGRQTSQEGDVVQSKSLVGTPDYIPPEIVMQRPHTFTVDWWALGIMIYECIMGCAPFHDDNEMEIYANIMKGLYELPTEEDVTPECIDIIRRLLDPNPATRLGAHGSEEVLNHPWFAGMSVDTIKPPFVPELPDQESTQYFECRYKFEDNNEATIREDIEEAKMKRKRKFPRPRSASLLQSSYSDAEDDESMSSFPSFSVEQLEGANREAYKRAICLSEDVSEERQVRNPRKSFTELTQESLRQKRRERQCTSFGSLDDSVLTDHIKRLGRRG